MVPTKKEILMHRVLGTYILCTYLGWYKIIVLIMKFKILK